MGRKVHPVVFRLGINKVWDSVWYAEGKEYGQLLQEDRMVRKVIRERVPRAGISRIQIRRFPRQILLDIHTARPGMVIGRRGSTVNELKSDLQAMTEKAVKVDVHEIERPELDAFLVAESIAQQLGRRISQKRAMKQAATRAMRAGAKGIKIRCSGRLSGSEMARSEWTMEGRVPLHTIRADIDYALAEALTTFGRIGVKVWVYQGDILPESTEREGQGEVVTAL